MLLQGRQLNKNYGPLAICKYVDVAVNQGELVTIVGPSGAGKSTLLQILGTLDKPDSGTLEILGKNPSFIVSFLSAISANTSLWVTITKV